MIRVIVRVNPLEDGSAYCDLPEGQSISEIIGVDAKNAYVELNGTPIPGDQWATTYPKDGSILTVLIAPEGIETLIATLAATLSQVAGAIGTAAGLAAGAINTGLTAIGLGSIATVTGAGLIKGAIMMGMSMAVTALVKPQTPSMKSLPPNRFFSLTNGSNSPTPYSVLPKLYGTFRMTPPLAGSFYTKVEDQKQYLLGLFCLGYGPMKFATDSGQVIVGDPDVIPGAIPLLQDGKRKGNRVDGNNVIFDSQAIWIGQSSFNNYPDVIVQVGMADAIMRPDQYKQASGGGKGFKNIYTKEVEETQLAYTMNCSADGLQRSKTSSKGTLYPELDPPTRIVTTGENPTRIGLDIVLPLGMYAIGPKGNEHGNGVELKVEWSRVEENNWKRSPVNWEDGTASDGSVFIGSDPEGPGAAKWKTPRRFVFLFNIKDEGAPLGQRYDVKLTRTKSAVISGVSTYYDDVTWAGFRTFRDNYAWNVRDPYLEVDRNVILMAIQVKATGTINGSLDTVSVAAQSVLKTVISVAQDGTPTFQWKPTNNPAWAYADVLQGFQLDKSRRVADEQIDWARLKEWADWCDNPVNTIDCQSVIVQPGENPNPTAPGTTQADINVTVSLRFPDGLYAISEGNLQSSGVSVVAEWMRVGGEWNTLPSFSISGLWTSAHTSTRSFTISDPTAPQGTKYVIRLVRHATWFRRRLSALKTNMTWKGLTTTQNGATLETITLTAKMNTAISWSGDKTDDVYGLWVKEPVDSRAAYEYTTTVGLPAPTQTGATASVQSVSTFALDDPVLPPGDYEPPSDPVLPPPGGNTTPGAPILPPPNPSLPGDPVLPPRFPLTEGAVVEYNWYHLDDETMLDRLRAVSSTGRAGWALLDGRFSIIQDNEFDPVQMFTPRNSRGLEISRGYPKVPDALRVRYVSTSSWEQAEKLVLDDWVFVEREINVNGTAQQKLIDAFGNVLGDISQREEVMAQGYRPAEVFETLETQGVTDRLVKNLDGSGQYLLADQAFREGRYFLAVSHLRTETYNLQVGIDNLVAQRGDCVYLCHDVLALGIIFGRILSVDGANLFLDQPLEPISDPLAIRVRRGDGEVVTYPVTISEEFENVVISATADSNILAGDMYTVGIAEKDSALCKVVNIEYQADLTATVTLVPAAPEIQCADQGFIIDSYVAGLIDDFIDGPTSITGAPNLLTLIAEQNNLNMVSATAVGAPVVLTWSVPSAEDPIQTITAYYTIDDWETSLTADFSVYDGETFQLPGLFETGTVVKVFLVGTTFRGLTTDQSATLEVTVQPLANLDGPVSLTAHPNNWEVSLIWVQPWDLPVTDPAYQPKPITYKATEVYYSYINDHTAVNEAGEPVMQLLATTEHPYGTHLNLTADVIYYYWVRNIDIAGNPGDFFPNNEDNSGLAATPTQDVIKYFQLLDDWNNLSGPVYQDLGARLNALEGNPAP